MNEKILELLDLLFTFILLGSLIRQIPLINKALISIEKVLESGSNILPQRTDHEWMLCIAKVCGFISLFFVGLSIVLSQAKVKFNLDIPSNLYLYLIFICFFFASLWISISIAKLTKEQFFNFIKSNIWLFSAPFLFLLFDLLFSINILESFSQSLFNLVLNLFGYQIPNTLLANFLAFTIVFYVSITFQFTVLWLIAQIPYLAILMILKIMRHPQQQERFLFLILLAFLINKLYLILMF